MVITDVPILGLAASTFATAQSGFMDAHLKPSLERRICQWTLRLHASAAAADMPERIDHRHRAVAIVPLSLRYLYPISRSDRRGFP